MITVCFTGHRPNKLGGYDWSTNKNQEIMTRVYNAICGVVLSNQQDDKTYKFICGGALGIDQMAFEIVNNIKKYTETLGNMKIITELAIPFADQYKRWNSADIEIWKGQLAVADIVTYVDKLDDYKIRGYREGAYMAPKMQKRNEYMVDQSDWVIAVWNGTRGGTANCVHYAQSKNKRLLIVPVE